MFVGIDFETFHDVGYSLRMPGMSMTDYIRDSRFEVFGASVKFGSKAPIWVQEKNLYRTLMGIDWDDVTLYAHHMNFDGFILGDIYQCIPKEYFCTMNAAEAVLQHACPSDLQSVCEFLGIPLRKTFDMGLVKGLHWKDIPEEMQKAIDEYAINDIEMSYELMLQLRPSITDYEITVLSETLRMFCDPVLELNKPLIEEALVDAQHAKEILIADCGLDKDLLRKNPAVIAKLLELGVEAPMKWSVKQKKEIPAFAKTDQGMQDLLNHKDDRVRRLMEARAAVTTTIDITRAERMLKLANHDGHLPVCYYYCRAHNKRWTGGNKYNLQNFRRGGKLRKSIQAPPGWKFTAADEAQIEARMTAYVSGQEDLLDEFRDPDKDPYNSMATYIFNREVNRKSGKQEDEEQGFIGKTVVLGCGYQMGGRKFRAQLASGIGGRRMHVSEGFANTAVMKYRAKNDMIVKLWANAEDWLRYMAFGHTLKAIEGVPIDMVIDPIGKRILLPRGNYLLYPGFRCNRGKFEYFQHKGKHREWKDIYGGKFIENLMSCLARNIIAEGIYQFTKHNHDIMRVVTTTHDEVGVIHPDHYTSDVRNIVESVLSTPPKWAPGLPLEIEMATEQYYAK